MSTLSNVKLIGIPKMHDERGFLAVIEKNTIPFAIKRVYYLYDVPSDSYRGGHAHKEQHSVIIALSGSFEVLVDDGKTKKRIMLNKPNLGLLIPTQIWREIDNFSSGAVCLVLASTEYNEAEYIRDYDDFKNQCLG
ncbi:sugar 3,4-ketoisomerase [Winogradskyella sediminis]|uniref:dTDP-4-dehydrorhamnose 3,5-epimerase n=1 Tax=Winogradskyella sediminis TaxID=1382466 RepID=A0A1H1P0P5_9FLAO|nr:FdtA/QdtA family cupin domain-containing protein [Winogradskyella sediminis]REG90190.1 dTDP-4-dehydrorhamnose 3,5-epimerase-like enzyme [Winogradskyella sediminis]SDS04808.1 dTDP-4-dehydrorhamnose 3,5-epimerase [Winogradskyella sediminis]